MNRFFHYLYILVRPLIRLLMPFRVVGLKNVPEGGALLCANHASGWDPVLIALALPNDSCMSFMAKEELFKNKLMGKILRAVGAFPIKRGKSDVGALRGAIHVGDNATNGAEITISGNTISGVERGVQVANADDSKLADNSVTLVAAGK